MHSVRPNKYRTSTGRRRWHIRVVMLRALGLLVLVVSLSVSVAAQTPDFTLNVNVDLVELQVTVLDEGDRNVANLKEADFQIFEDRIEQQIQLFRHDDRPVSLGLVIDNSRSMERRKDRVDTAAVSFVRLSNPQDEAFLIHFDDTVRLANDFTADVSLLEDTLASISPYGQTALYDAIIEGLGKMSEGMYDQKAILLVSDGADNASVHGFAQVLEKVRSTDVPVYPIGLLDNSVAGRRAREALSEIANLSGGRAFFPQSVDEIPVLTERIARELRELYTLGYAPRCAPRRHVAFGPHPGPDPTRNPALQDQLSTRVLCRRAVGRSGQ